ncbi:hypothetical protein BSR00_20610 [Serratia liquefaciens]|nr:hypothetical protein BSQ35_18850 [Serratia liquefaciens]RYM69804.1 hypothetical protein BSR00_20610 [Serratia liquefaciens]RYM76172.1 hypothetical protein BSR01_22655 [Serratia liquefaciens]
MLGPHPLRGCCKQRSNLLPADLSLTPETILSKLLGIHSVTAYKQLELFWVYIAAGGSFCCRLP